MASIFRTLIRKQSATRIINTFNKPILISPLLTHLCETKPPHHCAPHPIPYSELHKIEESNPSHCLQFYPSFPFGVVLNPIPSTVFIQSEAEDVSGDSQTIWADSVKKKRKKKMNKHKLKKLRKRLRRKT